MRDLFDDKLLIRLSLLAQPEHPVRVPFHIFYIISRVKVLVFREGNRKTGFDFLCAHKIGFYNCCAMGNALKILKTKGVRQDVARMRAFLCAAGTVIYLLVTL